MSTYLTEVASVPASTIAELSNEVKQQMLLGEIGEDELGEAINDTLEGYALGLPPKQRKAYGKMKRDARGPRGSRPAHPHGKKYPAHPVDRRYMVPGPRQLVRRGGSLNGLGSILDDIAAVAASAVQSGASPTAAINAAVNTVQGAVLPKPAVAPTSVATVAKTAIPVGMIALVVGAALLMSRSGGARKYRSNPSRRRSRGSRRGRRGGGMDMQKMLLLAGAGGAAWFLFLRPGATMLPAALRPATTVVKAPSTSDQLKTAAVSIVPSLFSEVSKLFTSSPTPTPTAAEQVAQQQVSFDWSTL